MNISDLSTHEVQMIQSALAIVSPTGGGSAPFTLMRKITEQTKVCSEEALERRFCATVLQELAQVMSD